MTSITAHDLHRMLTQVIPHMGKDDTMPVLCAVYIEARGDQLLAIATDRFTMGVARHAVVNEGDWKAVIPAGAIPAVTEWLNNADSAPVVLTVETEDDLVRLVLTGNDGSLLSGYTPSAYREFPNWRAALNTQVAADPQPVPLTAYNTKFLARWKRADTQLYAWQPGPLKALILMDDRGDFLGMQMPIRAESLTPAELLAPWASALRQLAYVGGQGYDLGVEWLDKEGDPWKYTGRDKGGEPLMELVGIDDDSHTLAEVVEHFGPLSQAIA